MSRQESSAAVSQLNEMIDVRRPGWSLERDFYTDASIYAREMQQIVRRGWMFAGFTCQIPQPGNYFVYEIDGDSIIIIRGDDQQVHALYNTCRHRGSLVCQDAQGRVGRLVCPYHQWTYARDGRLVTSNGMPDGFDKAEFGLHRAAIGEAAGLLFVSLADEPPDFAPAGATIAPELAPHGLNRAKVACQIDYEIHANWKLVWENNRECLHCPVGHPQYVRANFDVAALDDAKVAAAVAERNAQAAQRWKSQGLGVGIDRGGLVYFPDGPWYRASRTPLVESFVTESIDGQPVAPLMGDFRERDMGTLRLSTMPNFWMHASSDHAVSTRLTPGGVELTHARVTWLVHEDAEEGVDYDLDRLLPFWKLTSEQDWVLCENNQHGVRSSRYRPGPYSPSKEYNVEKFVLWYLKEMRG